MSILSSSEWLNTVVMYMLLIIYLNPINIALWFYNYHHPTAPSSTIMLRVTKQTLSLTGVVNVTMNVSSVNFSGLVSQHNHLGDVGDWQRERAADTSAGMMCRVNMEQKLKPMLCKSITGWNSPEWVWGSCKNNLWVHLLLSDEELASGYNGR